MVLINAKGENYFKLSENLENYFKLASRTRTLNAESPFFYSSSIQS